MLAMEGDMAMEPIYTVEEVGEQLRVPADVIESEIAAGRLSAVRIGPHTRVRGSSLDDYLERAASISTMVRDAAHGNFHAAPNFDHTWPDKNTESFVDVREGVVSRNGRDYHVRVGFTFRKSSGKRRRRSLVLVDRYASVEFVAADEKSNGKMASIIRDRNGKQLPVGASLPAEYRSLNVGPYRSVVDGPGSANGLAVICDADDLDAMVRHALIRYQFRKERL
jgi:excisionase family DNA binding protein